MSLEQSVLICDQVNPTLNEILEKNGLKITYEPEITPEQVEEVRNDEIIATGRSDYPNQVYNLIGFP